MNTTMLGRVGALRPDSPSTADECTTDDGPLTEDAEDRAGYMAEQLCHGFKHHDERDRAACIEAFFEVDRRQFAWLGDDRAREAAVAYVDSLWAKDAVEEPYVDGRRLVDPEGLDTADWSPVREALARRADVLDIDERYAEETTVAWRRHKTGGDYWTPTLSAQRYELRAAFRDPTYPDKTGFGRSGFGPLPARYLVGIECHDAHTDARWKEAVEVMTPYFGDILAAQGDGE